MPIMGKYYMYYGSDFVPPRALGRLNASRFQEELILDNAGMCRFHRQWAEEMVPEVFGSLFGAKQDFLDKILATASRINSRNSSVFWESERNIDLVATFFRRRRDVEGDTRKDLADWIDRFEENKTEAALDFWYEVHKGTHEALREF
jgi:glyceraldehyde-3-phosphate dehydrogenase (ferredoxin)